MIPKLRAWDKELKMMCDVLKIDFGNRTLFYRHWLYGVSREIDLSEVIVMQSTGLKDNDGIEFYKKDIVRNIDSEELGVVEYDEGQFRVSYNDVSEQLWEIDKDLQIIGNIYENPELLEDN